MKPYSKYIAEFIGTAALLIVIVGSGIMGENLSSGNTAITLLANSIATGAGLYVLIQVLGPISGAHFNPAVSLFEFLNKKLTLLEFINYIFTQILGAILGVLITHAMFEKEIMQFSTKSRGDLRFLLSEFIATFGLISIIQLSNKNSPAKTPITVALYIIAAYWCTSSTSFANPAVTIARSLTDTFSGIMIQNVPGFILVQIAAVFTVRLYKIILPG